MIQKIARIKAKGFFDVLLCQVKLLEGDVDVPEIGIVVLDGDIVVAVSDRDVLVDVDRLMVVTMFDVGLGFIPYGMDLRDFAIREAYDTREGRPDKGMGLDGQDCKNNSWVWPVNLLMVSQ